MIHTTRTVPLLLGLLRRIRTWDSLLAPRI